MPCRATPPARSTSRPCARISLRRKPPMRPTRLRSAPFAPECAELKLLRRAPGRDVLVWSAIDQRKAASQRCGEMLRIVPADSEAAASFRAVQRKRADDRVSARTQGALQPGDIGRPIPRKREKMKRRAVVPEVIAPRRLPGGHVGRNPCHPIRLLADTRARGSKRRSRQIEHGHVLIAPRNKAFGEPRGAAANFDDGRTSGYPGLLDQLQGKRGRFLKPAQLAFALTGVNVLPMIPATRVV